MKRCRARERERLIETVRTSGAPIKEVAEQLGVKVATAYFWMKQARSRKPPEFAMVVPTKRVSGSTLRVEVGGAVVHLESGFDAELLCEVVSALSRRSS
jgi:transposase-like protein